VVEPVDFADLLARLRSERHLSQGQLAKAAHLSRTYVYHLEHGLRQAPSARAVRALIRAMALHGDERRLFIQAFSDLTGNYLDEEPDEAALLDLRHLSSLLVENTIFPAHGLDRIWQITSWNLPAVDLFEITDPILAQHHHHLLHLVYDPVYRRRFQPWEELARRLTADFKYQTRGLAFLPEYREISRALKRQPDYKRLSDVSESSTAPAPSFVFHMKHSQLGSLALRTAISIFSGSPDFSIVVYLPGDQQTLEIFRRRGWQHSNDGAGHRTMPI
jgi:transcriptional regulator with XRE-family HTH domain